MTESAASQRPRIPVERFVDLVRLFSEGEIGADEYSRQFWEMWADVSFPWSMRDTVNEIFYATEDYVEYDDLRRSDDLDGDQLLARVRELEPELRRLYDEARAQED